MLDVTGSISGAANVTINSANQIGTVQLSGSNTYSGITAVKGGVLTLGNVAALGGSTLNHSYNGVISFGNLNSALFGAIKGVMPLALTNESGAAVALTVGGDNQTNLYSGVISGSGSLIKNGNGTLILDVANTYTGDTRVNGGTLSITNGPWFSPTSSVYIAKNAMLALNFNGTNTICSLSLGGYPKVPGPYGAFASGAEYISGAGVLMVTNGPAAAGTVLIVR
jgi:autotransporter-associated beta strand protein